MRIIKIPENDLGYHESLFYREGEDVPDGWAVIPNGMIYPDSFPFATLTVEGNEVTAMEGVTLPEPGPVPVPDNPEADMLEAVLDHEVRLIQLELGTNTTT